MTSPSEPAVPVVMDAPGLLLPDGRLVAVPLDGARVGRGSGCHVRLMDADVSRYHCLALPSPFGLRLIDAGSRKGIRLNGSYCGREIVARGGDVVELGRVALVVVSPTFSGSDGRRRFEQVTMYGFPSLLFEDDKRPARYDGIVRDAYAAWARRQAE